ncbi:MAG TPA: ferredoxin [Lachnospiraceae bacterium]|nr:ferredoxin [Lachnospiraceae bacterium]
MIRRIHAVYFSAGGNTAGTVMKTAASIGNRFGLRVQTDDFTRFRDHSRERTYGPEDLVIFGVPTYAGRVPNKMLPCIRQLFHGDRTQAVALVTFGNRSFDSSLAELTEELTGNGFHVSAAAAVVCPHSFANIGGGRPDREDRKILKQFAADVVAKIRACEGIRPEDDRLPEAVSLGDYGKVGPYYVPLGMDGQPAVFLKAKPKTDSRKCSRCGICAEGCPMGSISFENPAQVSGICIKCQACVKGCPQKAKYFDDPAFLSHKQKLETDYRRRAELKVFL